MKLSTLAAQRSETPTPQSILCYGEAKTGKTRLVAEQLAHEFNILWLDVENGVQTLMQLDPELQERITYIRIPDSPSNPVGIITVGKLFSAKQPLNICHEHGVVGCMQQQCKSPDAYYTFDPKLLDNSWVVVVDSLTQLSDSALNHIKRDGNTVFTAGVTKADYDTWGAQGALLMNVLGHMQQAPFHRVFISHADFVEEATGGAKIYPVCGTRALSARAARYFDHVPYLYRQNGAHKVSSSTTFQHNVMSGSRSDIDIGKGATLCDMLKSRKPAQAAEAQTAAKAGGVALTMQQRLAAAKPK